jgi:hypothetical protein
MLELHKHGRGRVTEDVNRHGTTDKQAVRCQNHVCSLLTSGSE